ncbi:MAG TPA: hypothetical protein PLB02_02425 [Thermoanaerobaculia bacterium]|nr:hypothetical protein [Thermoanaerobaculia bacterium]
MEDAAGAGIDFHDRLFEIGEERRVLRGHLRPAGLAEEGDPAGVPAEGFEEEGPVDLRAAVFVVIDLEERERDRRHQEGEEVERERRADGEVEREAVRRPERVEEELPILGLKHGCVLAALR